MDARASKGALVSPTFYILDPRRDKLQHRAITRALNKNNSVGFLRHTNAHNVNQLLASILFFCATT